MELEVYVIEGETAGKSSSCTTTGGSGCGGWTSLIGTLRVRAGGTAQAEKKKKLKIKIKIINY